MNSHLERALRDRGRSWGDNNTQQMNRVRDNRPSYTEKPGHIVLARDANGDPTHVSGRVTHIRAAD